MSSSLMQKVGVLARLVQNQCKSSRAFLRLSKSDGQLLNGRRGLEVSTFIKSHNARSLLKACEKTKVLTQYSGARGRFLQSTCFFQPKECRRKSFHSFTLEVLSSVRQAQDQTIVRGMLSRSDQRRIARAVRSMAQQYKSPFVGMSKRANYVMLASRLDLVLTVVSFSTFQLPEDPAVRQRIQGPIPRCGEFEGVRPAVNVNCAKTSALGGQDALMPAEQQQEVFWERYVLETTQWGDNRQSKQTPQHPDVRHKEVKRLGVNNGRKPAWVNSQLARIDSDLITSPEAVSSSFQGPRALTAADAHLEVARCGNFRENGLISDAVDGLDLLVQQGCHLPSNLLYHALRRCIQVKDLALGRRVHALTVKSGYEGQAFLATHLIGLYASHGRLNEAMEVFTKVATPDAYNWATIILAYARHGEPVRAIQLFRLMCDSAVVQPNDRLYSAVLKACAAAKDLIAGKEVHAHILASSGKPDKFVEAGLVNMYAKCGSLEDARQLFNNLFDKDVVTWTTMIAGYAQQGMGQEAVDLYSSMQQEGLSPPDSVTFVCLLQACAKVGAQALDKGKKLHAQIVERGLQEDVVLGGSLVNMHAKCGDLEDARRVFEKLPKKNLIAWNAMIAGYAQQGMGHEALSLYRRMQQESLKPDSVTYVCLLQACAALAALPLGEQLHAEIEERGLQADGFVGAALVNMYAKCGSMYDSQQVFDSLSARSIDAWNALVGGFARIGDSRSVFDLLDRMKLESMHPDEITFLSVLTVCSHRGLIDKGREYFKAMKRDFDIDATMEHYICMVDLLGRAGHLDEALGVARTMPFSPNEVVWRTLLGACLKWKNVEIGQQAFNFAISVDEKVAAPYVLMSNIYAKTQMWEAAREMQERRKKLGAWKKPGQSWWTDTCGVVHTFVVGILKHPETEAIHARLEQLILKLKKHGYVPHLESALQDVPDNKKQAELCGHSEKLAIAYALNKTAEGTTIRIVKNLRICEDCHTVAAHISRIETRTIVCRDASRFHIFKEGKCSCGDFW